MNPLLAFGWHDVGPIAVLVAIIVVVLTACIAALVVVVYIATAAIRGASDGMGASPLGELAAAWRSSIEQPATDETTTDKTTTESIKD